MSSTERQLFDSEEFLEVPLLAPRARKGAARGSSLDARFLNDYPPEWSRCPTCEIPGWVSTEEAARRGWLTDSLDLHAILAYYESLPAYWRSTTAPVTMAALMEPDEPLTHGHPADSVPCRDCLGMGSVKARVRLEAGHRCVRCKHPYIPRADAEMLDVEPSGLHECERCHGNGRIEMLEHCPDCKGKSRIWSPWSACDVECEHAGPVRVLVPEGDEPFEAGEWLETTLLPPFTVGGQIAKSGQPYEAAWRILTVHHLDGDKANLRWWNLVALCQRCHLQIQSKVVMERVYPYEHSEWFKDYVAGYYAAVYLGEWDITREEAVARMDELLALELA